MAVMEMEPCHHHPPRQVFGSSLQNFAFAAFEGHTVTALRKHVYVQWDAAQGLLVFLHVECHSIH